MSVSRAAPAYKAPFENPKPRTISFETAHFLVRSLTPADITPRACAWFGDAGMVRTINRAPVALTETEFREYIESHDGVTGHALGIFDRVTGAHIGLWAGYIDWERSEFHLSILVGERGYDPGPRRETQRRILEIFFDEFDLQTLRCSVLQSNARMESRIQSAGLSPEHVSYKPSAVRAAFEEIHDYSVPRDLWRKFRDNRAERDLIEALQQAAWAGI